MRLITLALAALFLAVPAFAQEREPDTIEHAHADAVAIYEAAAESYKADIAAYIAVVSKPIIVERRFEERVEVPVAVPADADERLALRGIYTNDGSCSVVIPVISGSYDREAGNHDVHAMIRTAASGGDCTAPATAFTLDVERRFTVGGWDATAKFLSDRRSTSALYTNGQLRSDGTPHRTVLPAGTVDTVSGYFGFGREVSAGLNVLLAGNLIKQDWADGSSTHTVHVGFDWSYEDLFDLAANMDFRDSERYFGNARASFRPVGDVDIFADGAIGLTNPASTARTGFEWQSWTWSEPDVRDWAISVGVGITFGLD